MKREDPTESTLALRLRLLKLPSFVAAYEDLAQHAARDGWTLPVTVPGERARLLNQRPDHVPIVDAVAALPAQTFRLQRGNTPIARSTPVIMLQQPFALEHFRLHQIHALSRSRQQRVSVLHKSPARGVIAPQSSGSPRCR